MTWVLAVLAGTAVSPLLAVFLSVCFGRLYGWTAWLCLGAGFLAGVLSLKKTRPALLTNQGKRISDTEWIVSAIFLAVSLKLCLRLVFKVNNDWDVPLSSYFGDVPFHINIIRYLASGVKFWPEDPAYAGAGLSYHVGLDLFNSLLLLSGAELIHGLIWVALLGSLATGIMLFRWGRGFTVAGFLFNGGFLGFFSVKEAMSYNFNWHLVWKNIFLTLFINQRSFLFAFPAGLLLLCQWRERFLRKKWKEGNSLFPFGVEALLYFSLPLFHMHTFIFLSCVLLFWFVCFRETRACILKLWGISLLPAGATILLLTDFLKSGSMIHLHPGWEQNGQPFLKFWLMNFGIFLPLVILLLTKLVFFRKKEKLLNPKTAFVFPACLLFVLFSNLMLSTWNWDNIKLLVWSYLILLPYIWEELLCFRQDPWRLQLFSRIAASTLLFFTGFIAVFGALFFRPYQGSKIADLSELRQVESAVKNLPADARFAAWNTHLHPLLLLGRKTALGGVSHGVTHGYPAYERKSLLSRLMMGDPDWRQIAKGLGIDYVYWGPLEKTNYPKSRKPWADQVRRVYSGRFCDIYDLRSL